VLDECLHPCGGAIRNWRAAEIAAFFATNDILILDPDGLGPLFEVPIVPPLPETVNFIP
jgi:hypothetical protein